MSDERVKRRKFLADALFAGGALGVAALSARFLSQPHEELPVAKVEPTTPPPRPKATPIKPQPRVIPREDLNIQGGMSMCPPDRAQGLPAAETTR